MRTFRFSVAIAALVSLWACSGGSGGGSPPPPNPASYPTAADGSEGAGGDGSAATASALAVGSAQARTLFPDFDVDWVKFDLVPGTTYELSASHLSTNSDVYARLYDTDGTTQLAFDDDYISLDPRIVFSVDVAGTYYAKITSYDASSGASQSAQASYTLSVHTFVDADGDDWSAYYDCDDADSTVGVWMSDVAGDGIDQDCDGIDALDPTVADAFEPDGDSTHARPLVAPVGDPWEYIHEHAMVRANARTLEAVGEEDWFSFTVPAHGAVELNELGWTGTATLTILDAADMSAVGGPSSGFYRFVENTTDQAKTYYARFVLDSGDAFYIPFQYSYGVDVDGDGAYTRAWDGQRDCDDGDPAVNPSAAETAADGVDSDCDGFDDA